MKHVFIIGSKGIPAKYGGFETFVEKLTEGQVDKNIKYHVACMADNDNEFEYNGAHCFNVNVPNIGPAKAVYYDMAAFKYCNKYIKDNNIDNAIVYVLACRIGPFIKHYKKQLMALGGSLFVNPDGHEWKRAKWNFAIRKYWKLSEKLMVKHAQLLVCDSKNIEKYIKNDYRKYNPNTTYIAYGADIQKSKLTDDSKDWTEWCDKHSVKAKGYFLVVGRFVPENNYETMIREFMKSDTDKDFVLVTNVEQNKFYSQLKEKTGFDKDNRIKFVGTVYNQELLKKIREEAFAYFHGHEVGGTNPSLLEALASTDVNLLVDVGFNREVAEDGALYWSKNDGALCEVINSCSDYDEEKVSILSNKSTERIVKHFSWGKIIAEYEELFTE
ncbi:MAG: DUF1972 domain-containing protein [Lachnospira sp.]|nr:DUF1972 domain-containing protein [Lachnospira sp.]